MSNVALPTLFTTTLVTVVPITDDRGDMTTVGTIPVRNAALYDTVKDVLTSATGVIEGEPILICQ